VKARCFELALRDIEEEIKVGGKVRVWCMDGES
jgi:hypothetical protein